MPANQCPPRDSIRDYAVGKLDDDNSRQLADHFDACPDCQAELETFDDVEDTLLKGLKSPVEPDPIEAESHLSAALARARAVGDPDAEEQIPMTGGRPLGFLPRELGEYQLLERLGQGGMGTVYKALHTKLDRVVALKVLATGRMAEDRAIARFEREMKAIGGLDHPNIVRAFDAREIDGLPVLMMECLEGMDLAKTVRRLGRVPVAEACEIARQASSALQYAYENGLVHRDVKPSNLMLTPQGTVKLLDLGLARWHLDGSESEEMTATGQAMGTADYMAPEQVADAHTADIRSDIYSLGCTLYKLITGRAPFSGPDYQGTFEKMTAHVEQPARPIRELAPEVPEPLAEIIARMLAKSPAERFGMPEEVGRALEPFCNEADLSALAARAEEAEAPVDTDGQSLVTAGSQGIIASFPSPLPLPGSWFNGRRPLWILLGLLGPLAAALGIIIMIQRNGETTKIEVPDGAEVTISDKGKVTVNLDGKSPSSDSDQGRLEQPAAAPREGGTTTLPTYRIEPPDILQIDMLESEFKGPYQAETHDVLYVDVGGEGGRVYFRGHVTVNAEGTVVVGQFGSISVVGKSIAEIETAIKKGGDRTVSVQLAKAPRTQQVTGQYLVRPDGTIDLRKYGTIDVAGKTVAEATQSATEVLAEHFESPEVSVDVVAYDSKVYYIIATGEGDLPDTLTSMPITRKETARDVIGHLKEPLTQLSKKHLWISRPTDNLPDGKILPIDLAAIIRGNTKTNHEILPGDRLFISDRPYREFVANRSPDAAATTEPDHEAILGTWEVVEYSHPTGSTQLVRPMDHTKSSEEAIKGVTIVIGRDGFKVLGDLVRDINAEYQINPEASPKLIDFRCRPFKMMMGGSDCLGIYELDGDTLRICVASSRKARPSEFWVEYGSNSELFVLHRVSKATSGPDENSFQGTWEVVSADLRIDEMKQYGPTGGTEMTDWPTYSAPYGELAPGLLVRIDQRTIVIDDPSPVQPADQANPQFMVPLWQATYVLDTSRTPRTIETLSFASHVCSGIYSLEGDRLTIRLGKDDQRPADLDAPAADGEVLLELKRMGPAPTVSTEDEQTPTTAEQSAETIVAKSLVGTWKVKDVQRGKPGLLRDWPPKPDFEEGARKLKENTRVVITDDTLTVFGDHAIDLCYDYRFEPFTTTGAHPARQIDFRSVGKYGLIIRGICHLKGDELWICASQKERPTDLRVDYESDCELIVLERIGPVEVNEDEKRIQGRWEVVEGEAADLGHCVTIDDRNMIVAEATHDEPSGPTERMALAYVLDPTHSPKRIEFAYFADSLGNVIVYQGIYRLEGDQLTTRTLYDSDDVGRRPKDFDAPVGECELVTTYRRVGDVPIKEPEELHLTIDVDAEGTGQLNGMKYEDAALLAEAVEKLVKPNVPTSVQLRISRMTSHERLNPLLDALKNISITDISLQVQPETTPETSPAAPPTPDIKAVPGT